MREICELDLFGDRVLLRRVLHLSVALLVACVALLAALLICGVAPERLSLAWLVACAAATAASLVVHELVHGALFRLMGGPGTRVRFGARDGMLYAAAPDLVLRAGRFVVVALGPTLLVDAAILALGLAALDAPVATCLVLAMHLSGCAGDLVFAREVVRERAAFVQDSGTGIRLFAED